MSRPTLSLKVISSLNNSWDGDTDDNFSDVSDIILQVSTGWPLHEEADPPSRPAAASNDRCAIATEVTAGEWRIELSDGTSWLVIPVEAAHENPVTDNGGGTGGGDTIAVITDPADTPASADALRDDLVANSLPEIRDAISTLADKMNSILTKLEATDVMADS